MPIHRVLYNLPSHFQRQHSLHNLGPPSRASYGPYNISERRSAQDEMTLPLRVKFTEPKEEDVLQGRLTAKEERDAIANRHKCRILLFHVFLLERAEAGKYWLAEHPSF